MDKSSIVNSPGTLTWLQAAEHVLREEGPEMHIRDLTNRILEQGMVKSNCATSLETLLYRHTSGSGNAAVGRGRAGSSYGTGTSAGGAGSAIGGGQNLQSSKFVRVPGKHGWFGLRDPHSLPSVGVPSVVEAEDRMLMDAASNDIVNEDHIQNGVEQELSFEPKAFYSANVLSQQYSRKRRHSYHSSGGESVSSLSGGSEDELAGDLGEMGDGDGSSEFTSDEEDSGADETLYRKKYLFVKRVAKNMIHENAALASQMVVIREKINKAQAEKKFLMERLANFERAAKLKPSRTVAQYKPPQTLPRLLMAASSNAITHTAANTTPNTDGTPPRGTKIVSRLSEKVPLSGRAPTKEGHTTVSKIQQALTKPVQQAAVTTAVAPSQQPRHPATLESGGSLTRQLVGGANPVETMETVRGGGTNLSMAKRSILMSESSSSSESDSGSEKELSIVQHEPITFKSGKGPGKRGYQKSAKQDHSTGGGSGGGGGGDGEEELELAMRCGKVRRLHPIALNDDGSPVYPIVIGGLKVYNLGKIIYDRPAYHSERYLLPVGFESSRTYPSTLNPAAKCSYTCKILDGGDNPIFEMVPEDDPGNPIRASSSTACQTIVLKKINKARDKQATNSGSGPEFFGYSNPTILNLLQKMPDAKQCSKYKFVRFAEPSTKSRRSATTSSFAARVGKRGMAKGTFLKRGLKGIRGSSSVATKRGKRSLIRGASLKSEEHSRESISIGSPNDSSSLAIAPVLGTGHGYGMDTMSYSSSNEASDNELVIDG